MGRHNKQRRAAKAQKGAGSTSKRSQADRVAARSSVVRGRPSESESIRAQFMRTVDELNRTTGRMLVLLACIRGQGDHELARRGLEMLEADALSSTLLERQAASMLLQCFNGLPAFGVHEGDLLLEAARRGGPELESLVEALVEADYLDEPVRFLTRFAQEEPLMLLDALDIVLDAFILMADLVCEARETEADDEVA